MTDFRVNLYFICNSVRLIHNQKWKKHTRLQTERNEAVMYTIISNTMWKRDHSKVWVYQGKMQIYHKDWTNFLLISPHLDRKHKNQPNNIPGQGSITVSMATPLSDPFLTDFNEAVTTIHILAAECDCVSNDWSHDGVCRSEEPKMHHYGEKRSSDWPAVKRIHIDGMNWFINS